MVERVGVLGASGFVGSAVVEALRPVVDVVPITAPRLVCKARTVVDLRAEASRHAQVRVLAEQLAGLDVAVNVAGNPDASSLDADALYGANALVPALLHEAARLAGVSRIVHVSSAVVQNDRVTLDSSESLLPFSPYSASKCLGEEVLRAADSAGTVVRYRPPSVHDPSRRVTRTVRRIARSPLATVARPGDQPTPQALLPNVASAIAFLATTDADVPSAVHHPWEGVTVTSLMEDLSGGRRPTRIPRSIARAVVGTVKTIGRVHRPSSANARRLELLWLGQEQGESWLTVAGWVPPVGKEGWRLLAHEGSP